MTAPSASTTSGTTSNAGGNEEPAGSNPMWHAKNLENGIAGDYLAAYGLTRPPTRTTGSPAPTPATTTSTLVAPWLWNTTKKVFLSTEDEQSIGAKADYVVNRGIGGIMIWELAGDYAFDSAKGEYFMGNTLTNLLYDKFKTASAYGASKSNTDHAGADAGRAASSSSGFAARRHQLPDQPEADGSRTTRPTTIPGGAVLEFDYPARRHRATWPSSPAGRMTVAAGHTGSNIGGLRGRLPPRDAERCRAGSRSRPARRAEVTLDYKLPIAGPSNYTLTFGGQTYALSVDNARGGVAPSGSPSTSVSPSTGVSASPCAVAAWVPSTIYTGGQFASHNGRKWKAQWWTQNETPGVASVWLDQGPCGGTSASPSASASPSPSASLSPSASPSPSSSPSTSPSASASPSPSTTGAYPAWAPNKAYATGDRVTYAGKTYQCRQPHTSIVGWEPANVPALWLLV